MIHYGALSATQPDSPVLRVDLFSSSGEDIPYTSFLLIRDPKNSEVWKADSSNSKRSKIDPADWLLPWKDGVNHTPFDLLMPFVNWPYEYENPAVFVAVRLTSFHFLHRKINLSSGLRIIKSGWL